MSDSKILVFVAQISVCVISLVNECRDMATACGGSGHTGECRDILLSQGKCRVTLVSVVTCCCHKVSVVTC